MWFMVVEVGGKKGVGMKKGYVGGEEKCSVAVTDNKMVVVLRFKLEVKSRDGWIFLWSSDFVFVGLHEVRK